jgi:putative oxidoreductase
MKYATIFASVILGLLFIMSAMMFFLNLMPAQDFPKDSAPFHFMAAFGPTGYMKFVKVIELLGGLLLLVPKTRNLGLLCIGPVLVNILAFHAFILKGEGLLNPMLIVICLLAAFLLWSERKAWGGLVK